MKTKLQRVMCALFAIMVCASMNAQTTTINYTAKQKIDRFEEIEYFVGATAVQSHEFHFMDEAKTVGEGTVVYEGTVTEFGSNCLQWTNDLYSIVVPEGVEKLGYQAFYACQKLTDIDLPLSLKEIGGVSGLAFEACTSLEKGHFVIKDLKWWCSMVIKGIYSNPIYYAKHIYDTNNQEITDLVIPEDITSIGDYAFCRCEGLKSVTFHDKMTYLGANSFYSCTGLTNVEIPASIKTINEGAFMRCSNLASVTIPEGIETIGFNAFSHSGLKTLTLPSTIRDMMQSFVSCEQLETLTLTDGITELDGSFYYCHALKEVRIPGSIKKLSYQDFNNCNSLETVVFDEGVEEIAGFTDNPKLKNITIPSTVKKIGSLRNNPSLETIFIPEGVEYLAMFDDCTALKQINIPSTITYIGTFRNCNALEKVIVADLKSWCQARHYDADWYAPQKPSGKLYLGTVEQNELITDLVVPEGTEYVASWAFCHLPSLTSVSIPSTVKYLGGGTFYGCTNIEEIVLPEGLEQFGYKEFAGCTKLAKLTIPSTVTKIDSEAFNDVSANIWCKAYPNKLYWRDYTVRNFMPEKATQFHVVNQAAWEEKYPEANCTFVGDIEVGTSTLTYNANAKIEAFDDFTKFDGAYAVTSHGFADGKGTVTLQGTVDGFGENAFQGVAGITSVEIPEGTQNIANYAFDGCTDLTTMTIPASVTSIGANAFRNCTGLTTLNINEADAANVPRRTAIETGLQHIGRSAFESCTGLTSLNLPATLTLIEEEAFWGMSNLADVYCNAVPANLEWRGNSNYRQFMPEKATKFHVAKRSVWEEAFPNANVTFVNDVELVFIDYKTTKLAECDAMLQEGDDEVCQQLVATAKADIGDLAFNEDKSLEDNKTAVDAIVTQLAIDLENHRQSLVGISEITIVEAAKGNAYNLSGQRVNTGYKGITIVNGKKLVSKK